MTTDSPINRREGFTVKANAYTVCVDGVEHSEHPTILGAAAAADDLRGSEHPDTVITILVTREVSS